MANVEIRLPFEKISNSQTITDIQEAAFQNRGLSMHRDELTGEELIDDHDKGIRILRVKARRAFIDLGKNKK